MMISFFILIFNIHFGVGTIEFDVYYLFLGRATGAPLRF